MANERDWGRIASIILDRLTPRNKSARPRGSRVSFGGVGDGSPAKSAALASSAAGIVLSSDRPWVGPWIGPWVALANSAFNVAASFLPAAPATEAGLWFVEVLEKKVALVLSGSNVA